MSPPCLFAVSDKEVVETEEDRTTREKRYNEYEHEHDEDVKRQQAEVPMKVGLDNAFSPSLSILHHAQHYVSSQKSSHHEEDIDCVGS